MALAVAILFVAVACAYSASLPALPEQSLPEVLEPSLDSALDALGSDKVRRSVLDDVKQLLDTQISALLEDGVKRIAGKKGILKRRLKPKTRSRRPLIKDKKAHPSISQEIENSEFIKVLTDSSLQDSADMALRKTVDELLAEEEADKLIEQDESNNSEIIQDNSEDDQAKIDSPINDHDGETENENDFNHDTSQKVSKKERKHSNNKKNHSKDGNHVIIEHSLKKHDDVEALENVVDLNEILKSTLKDLSDSSSHEDDVTDQDDGSVDDYISKEIKTKRVVDSKQNKKNSLRKNRIDNKSNEHEEHQIKSNSENEQKIHSSEDVQLERINHIKINEHDLLARGSQSNENDNILKSHNPTQQYTNNEEKLNKKEDNHSIKQHIDEKSAHDLNGIENHHSKTHHNNHHHKKNLTHANSHHEKIHHNINDKSDSSHSSNVSKIQVQDVKKDYDKISHTAELKSHIQENNKQKTDINDNQDLLITKEGFDSEKEENVTQENFKQNINVTEAKDKETKSSDQHATNKKDAKKKTKLTNKHKNIFKENSKVIDNDENTTEEKTNVSNDKQSEEKGIIDKMELDKIKDDITEEDKSITDETPNVMKEDITDNDNNNASSEEKGITEDKDSDSEEKKNTTRRHITAKDEKHVCSLKKHHVTKDESLQSAESEVIQELIHNKEMKKSYTFSVSFTAK